MSVLELCDREIAAVPLDASVADAINKMLDHHVGAVAVVDSEYRSRESSPSATCFARCLSPTPTRKSRRSAN